MRPTIRSYSVDGHSAYNPVALLLPRRPTVGPVGSATALQLQVVITD